ncbi:MAG TPA: hypothetical protein VLA89_11845 [Gemmatimonadales bacterium]|nr:hypothetical protein [Gemmatimonadales bacterium]
MPLMYGEVRQITVPGPAGEGTNAAWRMTRDGAGVTVPWLQSLVFAGRVFSVHFGDISTPIAGHAAIDADQPEGAVYFATTGTSVMPISIRATMETGATTLAQGGMMCAISNINVAAGTSTSRTANILNNKFTSVGISSQAAAAQAYTGNGTDPLTAGNFTELARISGVFDADAATTGLVFPDLKWFAMEEVAPVVEDIGSILLYGEAAANTLFGVMRWAELPSTYFN